MSSFVVLSFCYLSLFFETIEQTGRGIILLNIVIYRSNNYKVGAYRSVQRKNRTRFKSVDENNFHYAKSDEYDACDMCGTKASIFI